MSSTLSAQQVLAQSDNIVAKSIFYFAEFLIDAKTANSIKTVPAKPYPEGG